MKIAIILGTRPEIIKLSPVIRECEKRNLDYFVIHSNQHYSANMDEIFLKELKLNKPKYSLGVGSGNHGNQTGKILIKIEDILLKEKPDIVIVQGDTNTVLGGALAATKLNIKVAHVEAGLRSYNRKMPEETNRTVTDHISNFLFCPTDVQKDILLKEGISEDKIFVVGNTIVDAVNQNIKLGDDKIIKKFNLDNYFLVTAHRALNVDLKQNLSVLVDSLNSLAEDYNLVYPMHPRTKKMLEQFNLKLKNVNVMEPVGYLDFLSLEKNANLILTDSGGVQEEACILGVPCVTLREDTERPETVDVGANMLAGIGSKNVVEAVKKMMENKTDWKNPLGEGNTSQKILDIII